MNIAKSEPPTVIKTEGISRILRIEPPEAITETTIQTAPPIRPIIDAKSIMGIFSLDISKPIDLNIYADEGMDDIMAALKPYLVEE